MAQVEIQEMYSRAYVCDNRVSVAGAVLAGGRSSRMGQSKEGILLRDGRPMIEHAIDALASVCKSVIIVGACHGYGFKANAHIRQIYDNYPGQGPLAGLEALLGSGIASGYLVVACDQPLIAPQLLGILIGGDRAIPACFTDATGETLYPLPGYYPSAFVDSVRWELDNGRRSITGCLSRALMRRIPLRDEDIELMRSFNTPHELASLLGE